MYRISITILLMIMAIYLNSCGLSEDTVAKVGSLEINKDEYTAELKKRYPGKTSFTEIDSSSKYSVLDRLVNVKRKLNNAYDLDFDENESVLKEVKTQSDKIIMNKYFEVTVVNLLVTEEDMRSYFDNQKEEIKASHILIAYRGSKGSQTAKTDEEAKKLAAELAERAKGGEDFAKLAEEYSNDPSAKKNKGDLGFFTWGKMVPEFQEVAFTLQAGEISDPVRTQYGYHVIKVEARRDNPAFVSMDYEDQEFNIKRKLYFAKQAEGRKLWEANMDSMKSRIGFELYTDNVKKVSDLAKKIKQEKGQVLSENFSEDDKNIVLAVWDGGQLTLDDLINEYGEQFKRHRAKLEEYFKLAPDVEHIVIINKMFMKDALKMGLDREKDVQDQIRQVKERRMLSMVEEAEVKQKAEASEEELMEYYESHKEEFLNPEEIEIWEIFVKKESDAKKVLKLAKSGKDFEALAKKYTEDKMLKNKHGYVGFKQKNRRGAISREAFKVGENAIGGPVRYRSGWAVFKTGELKPKEFKSFEDAKNQVNSKLSRNKITERRKEWQEELTTRYTLTVNKELVEQI